ncbi:hypothetical protein EVAR_69670_1 [Eumeta japonica]|uniref:Uncharacterized protein n=1 Tax=Eumeta variegata TaxID=151549 RepID=A0A4C1ZMS9_EUMVA|nr:hypothetical protein EVAR_69670_1 [Eumeta japonica]
MNDSVKKRDTKGLQIDGAVKYESWKSRKAYEFCYGVQNSTKLKEGHTRSVSFQIKKELSKLVHPVQSSEGFDQSSHKQNHIRSQSLYVRFEGSDPEPCVLTQIGLGAADDPRPRRGGNVRDRRFNVPLEIRDEWLFILRCKSLEDSLIVRIEPLLIVLGDVRDRCALKDVVTRIGNGYVDHVHFARELCKLLAVVERLHSLVLTGDGRHSPAKTAACRSVKLNGRFAGAVGGPSFLRNVVQTQLKLIVAALRRPLS